MEKYFIDKNGNFLGVFVDGAEPPKGAIEVDIQPENALTQVYQNGAWVDKPKSPEQLIAEAKAQKAEALANITVTTSSDKVFDGDETARADMASALTLAQLTNQASTQWKLANNQWAEVTIAELTEALHLSLLEKGRIIGGEV